MLNGCGFSKLVLLSTLAFTYSNASNAQLLHYQGLLIMHYMPRNVSVRPHQVSHCVRTFDAVLRNNLYQFFM